MFVTKRHAALAALLASAAFAAPAVAQDTPADTATDTAAAWENDGDDIVVTAQKREENLQDVPISIQALGTRKLDQLNISNFAQYSQLLPSVAFQSLQPGQTTVYMRGVASGGDGNHSGSLPSVGVYLDEQPVTTIGGTLDVHVYDVARIESLAGPQGTLYGASSQAGTIRIITNKPDLNEFSGRIDGELNTVEHGGQGGKVEGYINLPVADMMALRVVGFYQRDAGYIDNVPGTRTFDVSSAAAPLAPGYTGTVNNAAYVDKDFNTNEVYGGRAALKIDLDDNWTVTPTVIYQQQKSNGIFGYDTRVGDLDVQRFNPDNRRERFVQAALTIEGKLGNWDVTYAGAYLDRTTHSETDYTDYSEAYDSLYSSVGGLAGYFYFQDSVGRTIDSRQFVIGEDHFKKLSQEFRVSSPQDARFRVFAGAFYQRQTNDIFQDYRVANLAPELSVNGHPGTLWLTQQFRADKDYAMFGEAAFDILPNLTATVGGRGYIYDNSLIGFFGFGRNPGNGYSDGPPNGAGSNRTGVAQCYTTSGQRLFDRDAGPDGTYSSSLTLIPAAVAGSPCTNLGVYNPATGGVSPVKASGQGVTYRFNLTWKPSDDVLVYGTWSRGFRPGGINRRADTGPYDADFLTNYELGLKTTLLDGKLRLNGAIYQQQWDQFQFSFLGANSFTEIHNGPNARIRGFEADGNLALGALTLTAAGSYTDAKTRNNLCGYDDTSYTCTAPGSTGQINYIAAAAGTRLPITPRVKANVTARYVAPIGAARAYIQAAAVYQGSAASDIRTKVFIGALNDATDPATVANPANFFNAAAVLGRLDSYVSGNIAIGAEFPRYSLELFVQNVGDTRAQLSRYQACGSCGQRNYTVVSTPRTIGIRAGAKF